MRDNVSGALIVDEMGTFFVDIAVESHQQRGRTALIPRVLVDTGAEATWLPREILQSLGVVPEGREQYQMADGRVLERELGYVIVHVAGKRTSDDVVFAEPGDLSLLGARSLEGLHLSVDARAKRLVPAGPRITAAVQQGNRSAIRRYGWRSPA